MQDLKKQFLEEIKKGKNVDLNRFEEDDLRDLIDFGRNYGLIDGLSYIGYDQGGMTLNIFNPRLTMDGKEYLMSLDTPVVREPIAVEVISPDLQIIAGQLQGLNKGQQEMIKLMAEHIEILDEMRFLEADKVTMMKERLVKMREEDKEEKFPWDTLINLTSVLVSVASKATTGV